MDEVDELAASVNRYDTHPFPYNDVRRLMRESEERGVLWTDDMILTGDLNTYFMYISGWAAGGIRRFLADDAEVHRIKDLLAKGFLEHYPQYRIAWRDDMSVYPELNRDLLIGDYLRHRLLAIISRHELDAHGYL